MVVVVLLSLTPWFTCTYRLLPNVKPQKNMNLVRFSYLHNVYKYMAIILEDIDANAQHCRSPFTWPHPTLFCFFRFFCGAEGDSSVRLQVGQGDAISGRVSRREVAETVVAALSSPYAAGKTFELRRDEVGDGKKRNIADEIFL